MREDRKTINVKESTYNRLLKEGKMGESFDSLINRLLDERTERYDHD